MPVRRLSLLLVLFCMAGCAGAPTATSPIPDRAAIQVLPVRNLAGVPVSIPELWLGDAGEEAAELKVDPVDMRLLVEAALIAGMQDSGHQVSTEAGYRLHAAVTRFELLGLRTTGRVILGVAVIAVDAAGNEITQGSAELEYQLMRVAPDQAGTLGDERFLRARLESLAEAATRAALLDAGL